VGQQHNELRRGPWSNAVSNALGDTKGGGLERYGETMQPVLDLWRLPEWAFLRRERLCAIVRTEGAVAGEFSGAGIVNPAGSGAIVVLEGASADAAGVLIFQMQTLAEFQAATLATVTKGNVRDRRWVDLAATTIANVVGGSDAAAGLGLTIEQRRSSGNMTLSFESLPIVLPPGFGVVLMCLTVLTAATFNFSWRERNALPGEL